jgi:hypothetical protein
MEDAFGTLVWIVAVVGAIVAVFTLAGTARSYERIGGDGIVLDEDDAGDGGPRVATAERDAEIRQLLEARNARRARRGEAQQDVEAELAALTGAQGIVDDDLREEIRERVVARNARRVRAGAAALDVDAEIERRIRELT